MDFFKVGERYVQASNRQEAEEILSHAVGKISIIVRRSNGEFINIAPDEDGDIQIWSNNLTGIEYCGKIIGGSGQKILIEAIRQADIQKSASAKAANVTKKLKIKERETDESTAIKNFEKTVPQSFITLYQQVMDRLDAKTNAYKLEIIDSLAASGITQVPSENWQPILSWFIEKVLDVEESLDIKERKTFFMLRKSFVTTIMKMVRSNVKHSNTMNLVIDNEVHDDDFWIKYAEEQNGS